MALLANRILARNEADDAAVDENGQRAVRVTRAELEELVAEEQGENCILM